MKRRYFYLLTITTFVLLAQHSLRADDNADSLNAQYKASMKQKDIEHATAYICEAANLDSQKYSKKCDSMRKKLTSELSQYEGFLGTGKFEFEHKDYRGAIRDLSKISFGPYLEEAQQLIRQANLLLSHPEESGDSDKQSLQVAQQAYNNGDFARATTNASKVKNPSLQPVVQTLLATIRAYNEAMTQGDEDMQKGSYEEAQQKYSAALQLKNNGPGDPANKLQRAAAAQKVAKPMADNSTSRPPVNKTKTGMQAPLDNSLKIKNSLAAARKEEEKGDFEAALVAYQQVLELDPKQADATAGRQRALDAIRGDPRALEDTLSSGIRSYYQSHLSEARVAISLYLTAGGEHNKGAAHFYLGATLIALALFSDPGNTAAHDSLQKDATHEFELAKQQHFMPAEKYISPRILAVWNQVRS